jgi:hypothetical protein
VTGIKLPDGNHVVQDDIDTIVSLIERNARWVHPEAFQKLKVSYPHVARGRPLYDAAWTNPYNNTRRATGETSQKFEGNVAAPKALIAALGVASPKPKNWTVCHIWGYDDPQFAGQSKVVQDPKYYSCVANMIWLPTSLKSFTDTLPQIKSMLRVCVFHLYQWACEHPSVGAEAAKIRDGWVPPFYPESWPSPEHPNKLPNGVMPFTKYVEQKISRRRQALKAELEATNLPHYPKADVIGVLKFWEIEL